MLQAAKKDMSSYWKVLLYGYHITMPTISKTLTIFFLIEHDNICYIDGTESSHWNSCDSLFHAEYSVWYLATLSKRNGIINSSTSF